jgi:hypothetical protein
MQRGLLVYVSRNERRQVKGKNEARNKMKDGERRDEDMYIWKI